jgi:DNA-binding NarL/FixJ family response regulator
MTSHRILVVEDHEPFRRFIRLELQKRPELQVIGEVSDGLKAVQQAEELQPDLILLDIGLQNLNGIEAAKRIRTVVPDAKLLFVSLESSPKVVQETFRLGAHGYIHKQRAHRDLLLAIDTVLEGGKPFVSDDLEFDDATDAQAPRRHEILFCSDDATLLDGLTHFIASALSTGNAAIVWATEAHRDSLLQRLRARGVDIDAAVQGGTYISSDDAETPDPVRMLQAVKGLSEAASKAGKKHPRVAVCGERAGRLWAEGKIDAAIRLEQLCNELARQYDVEILCAYPLPEGREDDQAWKTICAEHTAVIR